MIEEYGFAKIENKWQDRWVKNGFYKAPSEIREGEKSYVLDMIAYTSGSMHTGHVRTYTIGDVIARYRKRQGYKLLHPMGWDAFGLPADMAAVKHGIHPSDWTDKNIAEIAKQEQVTIVVQINGKLRDRMVVSAGTAEDEVRRMALDRERIKQWIEGKEISRIVVVPDKLVNVVIDA